MPCCMSLVCQPVTGGARLIARWPCLLFAAQRRAAPYGKTVHRMQSEDAATKRNNKTKGVFTSYQDRAISLKMDLKSQKLVS